MVSSASTVTSKARPTGALRQRSIVAQARSTFWLGPVGRGSGEIVSRVFFVCVASRVFGMHVMKVAKFNVHARTPNMLSIETSLHCAFFSVGVLKQRALL